MVVPLTYRVVVKVGAHKVGTVFCTKLSRVMVRVDWFIS